MNDNENNKLWQYIPLIFKKLPTPGILLVTGNKLQQKNIMTIGWLQFGIVWQKPIVNIYVRPSRYSYKLLQDNDEFTINVMPDSYDNIISICGEKSGSFCDKFSECNIQTINSDTISTPSLKDAEIIIECKIQHKTDIDPKRLNDLILARYYAKNDFHQIISASIQKFSSNKKKGVSNGRNSKRNK